MIRHITDPGQTSGKTPAFAVRAMLKDKYGSGYYILNPKGNWDCQKEEKYACPSEEDNFSRKPYQWKREQTIDQGFRYDQFFEKSIVVKRCIRAGFSGHRYIQPSLGKK